MSDRGATIAGLRQLADYLQAHPDVPIPRHGIEILVSVDSRETVQAAADALDVGTREARGGFEAGRQFGGGVSLNVYVLSEQRIAEWSALTSYSGRVTP
jgi:hypothetical protein